MLSNRPYLVRAFYQWIVDSGCNPILVIDANYPRVKVPTDYVDGGEIVFNISPTAIRDIKMLNDFVEFKASFSGVIHLIHAPIQSILSVYAEENGEGIFFDADENDGTGEESTTGNLSLLKEMEFSPEREAMTAENATAAKPRPILTLVE